MQFSEHGQKVFFSTIKLRRGRHTQLRFSEGRINLSIVKKEEYTRNRENLSYFYLTRG